MDPEGPDHGHIGWNRRNHLTSETISCDAPQNWSSYIHLLLKICYLRDFFCNPQLPVEFQRYCHVEHDVRILQRYSFPTMTGTIFWQIICLLRKIRCLTGKVPVAVAVAVHFTWSHDYYHILWILAVYKRNLSNTCCRFPGFTASYLLENYHF